MPSTYTVNLGIEKPATGEQSGTWGDTVNDNSNIIDEAVNGVVTITLTSAGSSGSPNELAITNGASSTGRNKWIEFADGGDLSAAAYVQLVPNDAEKICFIRNSLSGSRSVFIFQGTYSTSNDLEIAAGTDVLVKFNGAGTGATVVNVYANLKVDALVVSGAVDAATVEFDSLSGTGSVAVTNILDEDNLASNSATVLATQQSIKAYVDAQVDTVDTLAETLAIGNTTSGTDIETTTTDKVQFRDAAIYINSSADGQLDIVADTEVQIATTTVDLNGALDVSGTVVVAGALTGSSTLQGTTITATTAFVPDAADGAALGTTSLEFSDLYLADGAVIGLGADQDVTLTHIADTGIRLNTNMQLQFYDASQFINAPSSTVLDINATDEVELNATLVDVNANLDVSGTLTQGGASQFNSTIIVGVDDTGYDVKLFGATSGAYMLWDESADDLKLVGAAGLTVAGDIDIDGTANLDVVDIDGAVNMATTALVTGVLTTTATQVATGGITSGSSILSDTDSTDSLGSTAVRWLKGWFDTLTAGTLTIGSGSVTDSSGAISFGNENLTTTGIVTAAGTSVFTNLDISGDIDVDGTTNLDVVDIDGAVNMATTALVTGVLTTTATQVATGGITSGSSILSDTDSTDSLGSTGVRWLKGWFDTLTAGTLTIGSGSVTDSSGAISFSNENLTTTGTLACGALTSTGIDDNATAERFQVADTIITIGDAGSTGDTFSFAQAQSAGVLAITGSNNITTGTNLRMYGGTHSQTGDLLLRKDTTTTLHYDFSASKFNFQANAIATTGTLTAGDLTISNSAPIITLTDSDSGADTQLSASSSAGSFFIKVDQNNEAASSQFQVHLDGTERLSISSTVMDVQGGDLTVSAGDLTVSAGTLSVVDSARLTLSMGSSTANATAKYSTYGSKHYTNSEQDLCVIRATSSSATAGQISIGGGDGSLNAVTSIVLLTAANSTTLTGTTALSINSTQDVTIPAGDLTVGAAYGGTPNATYANLLVQGSTTSGITIGGTTESRIVWADAADNIAAQIQYNHANTTMVVGTAEANGITNINSANAVAAISCLANGDVSIPNGDLTVRDLLVTTEVSIANDAAAAITPPRKGGFFFITYGGDSTTPGSTASGLVYYDVGNSLTGSLCIPLFSTDMTIAVAARTGTDGTDGKLNIGIQTNSVQIENRGGVTKNMQIVFL